MCSFFRFSFLAEWLKRRRQLAFVKKRAQTINFDIPARFEAIGDLWDVIQTARNSRYEAISDPQARR